METEGKGNGGEGERRGRLNGEEKWRGKCLRGGEEEEAGRRTGEDGKGLKEVKEHSLLW